jgi:16S rRNA A1518/A1519 N6-dimethyltransferase RsmA/KsgA/DIM1 with predicted DNA glycosylase/AP lyase activity
VLELGSGWGGLARALARRCPKAQVIGIEAAFVPWAFSRLVQALAPLPNLTLRRADFLSQPLDQASLAVCYLFTGAMQRLSERLSPGTLIVSSTFALPGRAAAQTLRADDLYRTPIYLYAADPLVPRPRAD